MRRCSKTAYTNKPSALLDVNIYNGLVSGALRTTFFASTTFNFSYNKDLTHDDATRALLPHPKCTRCTQYPSSSLADSGGTLYCSTYYIIGIFIQLRCDRSRCATGLNMIRKLLTVFTLFSVYSRATSKGLSILDDDINNIFFQIERNFVTDAPPQANIWAVIVAGSKSWFNYRHQVWNGSATCRIGIKRTI